MIQLTPIVSRAKSIWGNPKKGKKLALNSYLLTVQILTNDVQVLILCLSYFITTVMKNNPRFRLLYMQHYKPLLIINHGF